MHAFVADTTPDVDWANIVGMHWEGRDTVRRPHLVLHPPGQADKAPCYR